MTHCQGRGNYFEVGGGGGANVSRGPRQFLPKTKNSPDLAHYFLGETQVDVQKQAKIKMNDNDSPKLGGGQVAPTAPPVPASLHTVVYPPSRSHRYDFSHALNLAPFISRIAIGNALNRCVVPYRKRPRPLHLICSQGSLV